MNDYSYNRLAPEEKGGTSVKWRIDAFLSKLNKLSYLLSACD